MKKKDENILNFLNKRDINSQYPLFCAVEYSVISKNKEKNYEIFEYMLKYNATTNIKTKNGVPLLIYAIEKNEEKIVEIILSQSEEIDFKIDEAIIKAINNNNKKIECLLLEYSKNHKIEIPINKKTKFGKYLLIEAINQNNFELVTSLIKYAIEQNVDMSNNNDIRFTPLIFSYNKNYLEIFKFLVKYLNINEVDTSGNNLLYYAIEKNDIEMVRNLIKTGINTNNINNSKVSIFDYALSTKNEEILNILIDNDCVLLNEQDSEKNTPLLKMIKTRDIHDKLTLIKKMIEKGSNVNIYNSKKETPLNCAIQ